MWFGTFNGLNRYDGYTFKTFYFQSGVDDGISHNYISSLLTDQYGNLWIGTGDGLNYFDHETQKFKTYKHDISNPHSIADNQIESLLEDKKGRIWIGTRNSGLECYFQKEKTFIHYSYQQEIEDKVSSNFVKTLFEDKSGNIWIGHSNGAVDIFDINTEKFYQLLLNGQKPSNFRIHAFEQSDNGDIWIGSQGSGLYRVKYFNGQFDIVSHFGNSKNVLESNIILSLHIKDNTLWIGSEDKGLFLLNLDKMKFTHYQHDPFDESSLSHNSIWKIYEDRDKNIWIGTYAYGINLLSHRKSAFQYYQHHQGDSNSLSHNMVNTFAEEASGNLWIGTDGGGLNYFDRNSENFTTYNSINSNLQSDVIVSIYLDKSNRLWLGTWSDGLYCYEKEKNIFKKYTEEDHGLGSNRILDIAPSKNGGLWLASFWGGLSYFNPDSNRVIVYKTANSTLSDDNIRTIMEDFDGIVWIGSDIGLNRYDPKTNSFQQFSFDENTKTGINKGFVHCITQTSDSLIWIGTSGGLNNINPNNLIIQSYSNTDNFPGNEIKSITEDSNGILWIASNHGISKFNRHKNEIFKYDVIDGLQSNEFNTKSALRTSKGEIVLGGNNGFNIFHPNNLQNNQTIPPVIITDFKLFNKSVKVGDEDGILDKHISVTKQINLEWHHGVFSIDFAALNYQSSEKNIYSYIMEGFETEWNTSHSSRTATYTNLDPEDYVFHVKASNNDGKWNDEGASISIHIDPPFWKTWWAYGLETILIILIVLIILNHYISRKRLQNALKFEHMELEKLFELDQYKTRFFANISHEFHSPMTLILSPVEKLISTSKEESALQKSLLLIRKNAHRLQRMISQLRDFQKIETGNFPLQLSKGDIFFFIHETVNAFREYAIDRKIKLIYEPQLEKLIAWFDADKLDKIIYNLLSNAFKFTPDGGEISVNTGIINITKDGNRLVQSVEIKVKDSGIGISKDKLEQIFHPYFRVTDNENSGIRPEGTGIGLSFVQELTSAYDGEISVESEKGLGTEFRVCIPLDEHYLEENQLVGAFTTGDPEILFPKESLPENQTVKADSQKITNFQGDIPVVLVVDDDDEIRDYIESSLYSKYRFLTAQNGQDGLILAETNIPDLIVSDIKMPKMDGINMCNHLKEAEKTNHIPVILLTAFKSKKIKMEGIHKGADAYLQKPFNIDLLEIQIDNLLTSRKKLREKFSSNFLQSPNKLKVKKIEDNFVLRIIKIIEDNIDNYNLNADFLSKEAGMSRMQLYRKLRGLTDQTVHEFIHSIRLKKAVQLLEERQKTITEIAFAVGYNDLSYFARCFRKQYGKSPSEYISKKG